MAAARLGLEPMTKNPLKHEPRSRNVYEDDRSGDRYQMIFVDDEIVVLRDECTDETGRHYHRIEKRSQFDAQFDRDRLNYKPDSELDLISADDIDWADEVDHIGDKTTEEMHEEDYRTIIDIRQAEDSELLTVDGLGVAGLDNLRSFAE